MDNTAAIAPTTDRLSRAVDYARRKPGTVLAWVLGVHFVVWSVLPMPTPLGT